MKHTITRKELQLGFFYVSKQASHFFPTFKPSAKIVAIFDDEKEVEVTYNAKYRRIHGLTDFYRRNNARIGDIVNVEVLQTQEKYRFTLEKSSVGAAFWEQPTKESKPSILVGPPINFRGLMYAPINENGVIFLFSKVAEDLGITLEGIQARFPDAFGKRYEKDKGYPITMEFEYRSSDYERHGHPKDGCDLIICWEHDWKECSMQVIELKSLIKKLQNRYSSTHHVSSVNLTLG